MRSTGGFWICWIKAASSSSLPSRQQRSSSSETRMCSRERSGSASMPSRPSRPDAVFWMRSRSASSSARIAGGGAASERSNPSGLPAVEPGV